MFCTTHTMSCSLCTEIAADMSTHRTALDGAEEMDGEAEKEGVWMGMLYRQFLTRLTH